MRLNRGHIEANNAATGANRDISQAAADISAAGAAYQHTDDASVLTSSPWALAERSKDEHGLGTGMRQLAAKRVKALCSLLYHV